METTGIEADELESIADAESSDDGNEPTQATEPLEKLEARLVDLRALLAATPRHTEMYVALQHTCRTLYMRIWQRKHAGHVRQYQRQRRAKFCTAEATGAPAAAPERLARPPRRKPPVLTPTERERLRLAGPRAPRTDDLIVVERHGQRYLLCPRCRGLVLRDIDGHQCTCCGRIYYDFHGEVTRPYLEFGVAPEDIEC